MNLVHVAHRKKLISVYQTEHPFGRKVVVYTIVFYCIGLQSIENSLFSFVLEKLPHYPLFSVFRPLWVNCMEPCM